MQKTQERVQYMHVFVKFDTKFYCCWPIFLVMICIILIKKKMV